MVDSQHEQYERVVAIIPTGWEQGKVEDKKKGIDSSLCRYSFGRCENIVSHGYAYSEHCSFTELKMFLDALNYKELTCIVDGDHNEQLLRKLYH